MIRKKYPENDYFYLGKVLRPHGYKGGLKITLDVDDPKAYRDLDILFIEMKTKLIPHFIENIHIENNKANVKLQDVDTIEDAERYLNCSLFLPVRMLPALQGNRFYFHEVTGFRVIDEKHGEIGEIERVLDLPNNALFSIRHGEKEILVPIVDDILLYIDRSKKEISIRAPEGLIDIYLE